MKKLVFSVVLVFIGIVYSCAQNAENAAAVKKDIVKEYARASITTVFNNRGENLSKKLVEHLKDVSSVPNQFNDNSIMLNVISGNYNDSTLQIKLQEQVSRDVVNVWFPWNNEEKAYSTRIIAERGMYNASDADVIAANASQLKDALLKDAGFKLIDRSYIVVYDPFNIKPFYTEKRNKKTGEITITKGFEAHCNVLVYKLDWTPEVYNALFENWTNPNAIRQLDFPLKFITSLIIDGVGGHIVDPKKNVTEDEDMNKLAVNLTSTAYNKMITAIEDFKVKAPIFAVRPIRSKIGTKEGVSVDQRYFVYELELNDGGETSPVRKGVVRATGKIAKNDTIAIGDSEPTQFYQTYGRNLQEGMLLQHQPDFGGGLSVLIGNDLNVLAEIGAGMWVGAFFKSTIPYGIKAYARLTVPFATIDRFTVNNAEVTYPIMSFGLSKDFYFAHYFAVTPYLGIGGLLVPEKQADMLEAFCRARGISTWGFDAGATLSIAILHNIQVLGNTGYNGVKKSLYPGAGIGFGLGVRYQF